MLQHTARWRNIVVEARPLCLLFLSGKHQWEGWICMSGRVCQWAHWEGWASGWSWGSSPVSAQSTTTASHVHTRTDVCPEPLALNQPFEVLRACVRLCVDAGARSAETRSRSGSGSGSGSGSRSAPNARRLRSSSDEEGSVTSPSQPGLL